MQHHCGRELGAIMPYELVDPVTGLRINRVLGSPVLAQPGTVVNIVQRRKPLVEHFILEIAAKIGQPEVEYPPKPQRIGIVGERFLSPPPQPLQEMSEALEQPAQE